MGFFYLYNIFIGMRKIRLTEEQMVRMLMENELEDQMLTTYRTLTQRITSTCRSSYSKLMNLSLREILEGNHKALEQELDTMDELNEKMYNRIQEFVDTRSEEEYDANEDFYTQLSDVSHDLNKGVYRQLEALSGLVRKLDGLAEYYTDEGEYGPSPQDSLKDLDTPLDI
jgi:methyl-accepting chemotaxis protein